MTIKELYASIDGNYDAAKRILQVDTLIEKFLPRLVNDKSYTRLKAAAEAKDNKEMFEASHAMKGVFANLGFENLSAMASQVSEEFRPGKDRTMSDEELAAHLEALDAKYQTTMQAITAYLDAKKK